ncbi:hypothetical protein LE181_24305 [Streptomyces sp. SCA3-4]|uniref:DUF6891 domain-containing protein n=1 Tax=Streptomyces sichuanensis TaxID=2871810 RepID=UPI001CE3005B|nr:hypothetical protein [Streptomyces sichuanensis]MCA6095274.1 hypothetical protein [Streptomyces sichuanensis]
MLPTTADRATDHAAESAALDPQLLGEAEAYAAELVRRGLDAPGQVAELVSDYFYADGATPVSPAAAREIVGRLWRQRLAEQETWPEVTDVDRLESAFAALDGAGITARAGFTCCMSCGTAEIGGEAAEGDHGYVFFHTQDADAAAAGHGLWLRYGVHGADADGSGAVAVGRAVVAALAAAGLTGTWDGNPARAISIDPVDWRKRLSPLAG